MASASLGDVLDALAQTPLTSYLQRLPTGLTTLQTLYDLASEAGLVPASASDDIARLHALFDVALDNGMGSLVRDYVTELSEVVGHRESGEQLAAAWARSKRRRRRRRRLPRPQCRCLPSLSPALSFGRPPACCRCAPTAR